MTVTVLPVVEELVRFLAEALDAEEVILFGSRARGDAHAESDADILVITSAPVSREAVSEAVGRFGRSHRGAPLWTAPSARGSPLDTERTSTT